ncbi:MAG: MoxR family ATPase [Alphaproteobacteria bacterium]|nr:MoxR family ATPase [Alphaproteobacteria bacterium]
MSSIKERFIELQNYLNTQIVGQSDLIQKLLLALLSDGHLLVEGLPGLAKTKAVKVLSGTLDSGFQRIQFTPDLLPSDVTGSDVYRPETGSFTFKKGPIFNNLILADEINRAPAKVQSALLEAMGERQVTVGNETYRLPDLFMVLATQNPIEQEGTYNLPEAQLDRFLMYVKVSYPDIEAERKILKLIQGEEKKIAPPHFDKITQDQIFQARQEVLDIYMSPEMEEYLVQFIMATRHPEVYGEDVAKLLQYGVSPRGTIALDLIARASAWLSGRDFVIPRDIQGAIPDVLRHRIILSFEAKSARMTADDVLKKLLERVPLP